MKRHHQSSSNRRGAVLPIIAVALVAILLIVALTINSNWFLYSQINAQNSADIAAHAALVRVLDDTQVNGRIQRARDLGEELYNLNYDRPGANFDGNQIRFGSIADLSSDNPQFVENSSDSQAVSAVFVDEPTQTREVGVFLSNILGGPEQVNIVADATVSSRQIDIVLCLDASRSMNRLPQAKKAFPPGANSIHEPPVAGSRWFELVDTVEFFMVALKDINPNSRVGLVTLGGGLEHGSVHSPLDAEWARIEHGLVTAISPQAADIVDTMNSYSQMPALGLGTSHYDGIVQSLDNFGTGNSSRHIILLSDGLQVTQDMRPDALVAAGTARNQSVTIHTISFGGNFGAMTDIANETGGLNFTAVDEDQLRDAFTNLLARFRVQLVD